MVEKLSIRIQLEGADEIEQQLESLGDAGKQAFVELAQEAEAAGQSLDKINTEQITKKLAELGVKGPQAFEKMKGALDKAADVKKLTSGLSSIEDGFNKIGAAVTRGLGPLGGFARALGPIGIAAAALGVAFGAVTSSMLSTAQAISKMTLEAAKIGLTFEGFKTLRDGLVAIGVSAESASKAIEHFAGVLDKLKVAEVKKDLDALKAAMAEGWGIQGTAELQRLQEAARGIGPAADAAREALKQLGVDVPNLDPVAEALKRAGIAALDTARAFPLIVQVLREMPDSAQRTALALHYLGDAGLAAIGKISPLEAAMNQLSAAWAKFKVTAESPFVVAVIDALTASLPMIETALGAITKAFGIWYQGVIAAFQGLGQGISDTVQGLAMLGNLIAGFTWDAISAGVAAFEAVNAAISGAVQAITQFAASIVGFVWDSFSSAGVAAFQAISDAVQTLINWVTKAIAAIGNLFSAKSSAGIAPKGMAGGGLMGGRGTGTSDSNLAWLSRGEYITPARAVRQPGVLAFLEALRRSGGNLRRVLDRMGHFALGGMVRSPLPAFAAGGLASMSNVTIQFPGLPAIGGLRASSNVVDELRKAAALAQVRSGGRKPSRYS